MIETNSKNSFQGEITVASRIIDYLSSGLYKSPAACLKELINNSYDADATKVEVFVKPDADRIIISDDGNGLNREEFQRHFDRICESHKRDTNAKTKSGRPKIGKIGIGFIAANEICDFMEIYSTKKGSTELLHVEINFKEMRDPLDKRRRGEGNTDFAKADYVGEVLETDKDSHYTEIFLKGVRGYPYGAKNELVGDPQIEDVKSKSLYGLKPESIMKRLSDTGLKTWKDFDMYTNTLLEISLNIPVRYHAGWIPSKLQEVIKSYEDETSKLNFSVFYDGSELRKPTIFNPADKKAIIESFEYDGKKVAAKGYFYAQHGVLNPIELQGLLVRIRHAAVGEYDQHFWGFPHNEFQLMQRWVSAEIWADDRLEDAMNIDRRTLRDAHPAFVELKQAIHKHLRKFLNRILNEIYKEGSTERQKQNTVKAVQSVVNLSNKTIKKEAPRAAKEIIEKWSNASNEPNIQKALLKKYTVVEFYEITIEIAKEILPPDILTEFLNRLTKRLGGKF